MATDRELIKQADRGRLNAKGLSDLNDAVAKVHRRVVTVGTTDVGANTDSVVNLLDASHAGRLISIKMWTAAAVTADPTNYKSITCYKNDGAGGAGTAVTSALDTSATGFAVGNGT